MSQPASKILWGTNFENVLDCSWPQWLDSKKCWRRPVVGSEKARGTSTQPGDTWIYGYDYCMVAQLRWFGRAAYGNPVGMQAFLDYAIQQNPFRFVPNTANPLFYVDNCYLDDPLDNPQPTLETDGSQTLVVTIRNAGVDFNNALRGVLFEYLPGMSLTDPLISTFTRTGAASYLANGAAGISSASAASGVLRDRHYLNGIRHTLLECTSTNSILWSEAFDNAVWSKVLATVTADAIVGPDGLQHADKLVETAAAGSHYVYQNFTIASGDYITGSFFVRAAERSKGRVYLADGAVTNAILANFDLTAVVIGPTSTVGAGSNGSCSITPLAYGWFRVTITGKLNAGVTSAILLIELEDNSGNASYTGDGTSGFYLWGAQAEDKFPFVTSYIPTTTVTVSRVIDDVYFPFGPGATGYPIQTMTVYGKYTIIEDNSTIAGLSIDPYFLEIGLASGAGNTLYIYTGGSAGSVQIEFQSGVNAGSGSMNIGYVIGDVLEFRGAIRADGQLVLGASKNGGPETLTVINPIPLTIPVFPVGSSWGDHVGQVFVMLNHADTGKGCMAVQAVRILAGEQSLATCRTA